MRRISCALLILLLGACSHAPAGLEEAEIARLSLPEATARLEATVKEVRNVDERWKDAELRRDNYKLLASTDATKQNFVDGAEAEIDALRERRGRLAHRQHLLEGRLRELRSAGTAPK
jgi:hypothetical protein